MKLAIFLPNWVGDAAMAVPAVRAMRRGMSPSIEFVGVARPGPAALLKDQGWFDDWLVYKSHGTSPILNRRGLVVGLRKQKCDAAVLMTNSFSSAAIAAFSGIPRRIGYARDARTWLLTDRLNVQTNNGRPRPVPAIDYFLQLADFMGCPSVERMMEFSVDPKFFDQADQLWETLGFCQSRSTIVLNNNAATQSSRLWPEESLERLAKKLVRSLDVQVLLHCSPNEIEATNRLAHKANHPRIQSMGKTHDLPMGLSQAIFARSSALVTTDSGARHLAIAMNLPVITLFGPTQPAWTQTYNVPESIIQSETQCEECEQRTKLTNSSRARCQCMRRIKPEQVFMEVLNRLKAGNASKEVQAA